MHFILILDHHRGLQICKAIMCQLRSHSGGGNAFRLKINKLLREGWACLVSVVGLPALEEAVNMNQGCLCKLLCPLPLPPLPCALTGLFIVLPLLCLLSQACVCWLLTGFGLKEQMVTDVRTGNGGDIRVAGYFPLFLSKLVILIEVVASSIKQIHQMAWVWVPANCIPHSR